MSTLSNILTHNKLGPLPVASALYGVYLFMIIEKQELAFSFRDLY